MATITYNLKEDINSGAIEIYSPNTLNSKITNWDSLAATANLHNVKPLYAAKKMMQMYEWNYGRKEDYPQAEERINNWKKYIENYSAMTKWKKYATKKQRVDFYWKSLTLPEKMQKLKALYGKDKASFSITEKIKKEIYDKKNIFG